MRARTQLTATAFVAVIAQLLARGAVAAAGDENDNQAEFAMLCHLIRAAKTGFKEMPTKLSDSANSAFNSIQQIHILAGSNDTKIAEDIKAAVSEETKRPKLIPHTSAGNAAKAKINETYEIAKKIKEKVDAENQKNKDAIEKANKLLAEALTGDETKQKDEGDTGGYFASATDTKMFGASPDVNKNCGGTGGGGGQGDNAGVTLINDLLCLCVIGPSSTNQKICAGTPNAVSGSAVNYGTPATTFKTHYSALIKKCPPTSSLLTPATLATTLMTFTTYLGRHGKGATTVDANSPYILGLADSTTTGCTTSSQQTCVNYKHQLSGGQPKGIPWLNKMQQAVDKAGEATPGVSTRADETALIQLNAAIWNQYKNAFVAQTALVDPGNPSPKLLDPKKAEECKIHKPKKECEENNCKWDGKTETDGECKPKAG
uniref:Variant surface glycoprotein 1125.1280 n=1 Tax=Trypanosoma brucei TaxID=5691 RepID=A0A1J0R6P0_9TRYP|nr:variant surface glycoprotein 1125.1280 [Trypanosoma brucei]